MSGVYRGMLLCLICLPRDIYAQGSAEKAGREVIWKIGEWEQQLQRQREEQLIKDSILQPIRWSTECPLDRLPLIKTPSQKPPFEPICEVAPKVIDFYRRECFMGSYLWCYELGNALAKGERVPVSLDVAFKAFDAGCRFGHIGESCHAVAALLESGIDGPPDYNIAAQMYRLTCRLYGSAYSCVRLGEMLHYLGNDPKKALDWYAAACHRGSMRGCLELGWFFQMGEAGYRKSAAIALTAYLAACRRDPSRGCSGVGISYEEGLDVPRDVDRAIGIYRAGCNDHDPLACAELARAFEFGIGVPQDVKHASDLHQQSCQLGYQRSCLAVHGHMEVAWLLRENERLIKNPFPQDTLPVASTLHDNIRTQIPDQFRQISPATAAQSLLISRDTPDGEASVSFVMSTLPSAPDGHGVVTPAQYSTIFTGRIPTSWDFTLTSSRPSRCGPVADGFQIEGQYHLKDLTQLRVMRACFFQVGRNVYEIRIDLPIQRAATALEINDASMANEIVSRARFRQMPLETICAQRNSGVCMKLGDFYLQEMSNTEEAFKAYTAACMLGAKNGCERAATVRH